MNFDDCILLEDDAYILINKPYNVSSLDDRLGEAHSIIRMAKKYWTDAQLCHRLDKETSGVLAIAKTPEAYRHLSMQFEHREVAKIYHAVIEGTPQIQDLLVEEPILKTGESVRIDRADGKEAATLFNTFAVYRRHSLLTCLPVTGRMHQIRIHLSAIGWPIVGDHQYGGKDIYLSQLKRDFKLKKWTEEEPLIKRVALHARELRFKGLEGQDYYAEAPYPKDFSALIRQLEKNV